MVKILSGLCFSLQATIGEIIYWGKLRTRLKKSSKNVKENGQLGFNLILAVELAHRSRNREG